MSSVSLHYDSDELEQRLRPVLRAALEEAAATLEERIKRSRPPFMAPDPSPDPSDLQSVYDALAILATGPAPDPTAIWFVECPDIYDALIRRLSTPVPLHYASAALRMGARLIKWQMCRFDPDTETIARQDEGPEERARLREAGYERVWPWFVVLPGIWMEMSDGSVRRLPLS